MDIPPELLVFVVWGVLALLSRKANRQKQRPPAQRRPPVEAPGTRQRTRGKPETFEDLLTEMREQLEAAKRAEEVEEIEERESLEEEPVVVSLEVPARIDEREVVDPSIEMQRVIQQRLHDAEKRNRAWQLADHKAFDKRIRAPVAETALPLHRIRDLRRAVVWREILGKPVSLRDG